MRECILDLEATDGHYEDHIAWGERIHAADSDNFENELYVDMMIFFK